MKTDFFGFDLPVPLWLVWPGFLLVCGVAGLFLGHLLRKFFLCWSSRTRNYIDDLVAESFGWPLNLTVGLLAIVFAARLAPMPESYQNYLDSLQNFVKILILFLFLIGAVRFASRWIERLGAERKELGHSVGILKPLLRIIILCIGLLVILHELGVNILPILTGLGVGGVAVALALQSTLANFFAGITLVGDRQVRQGDFIQLDSGLEGFVQSIGWKSTLIQTREHKIVIIPNQRLSESIITNFHLPQTWIIVPISLGVSYSSDPEKVERVVLEEIGALASFEDLFEARDLVRKRIFARFRREGIEIPFPQRDLHIKDGSKVTT